MAVLRSPYGHARITRLDVSKAQQLPGVLAVITGKDAEGKVNPVPCAWLIPDSDLKVPAYRVLATDHVRFTGDGVAAVVAETPSIANDALGTDRGGLRATARRHHAGGGAGRRARRNCTTSAPGNQAFHWKFATGDADGAKRDAEVTLKQRFVQQRLIPNAMEPRGTVAAWNP